MPSIADRKDRLTSEGCMSTTQRQVKLCGYLRFTLVPGDACFIDGALLRGREMGGRREREREKDLKGQMLCSRTWRTINGCERYIVF